MTPPAGSGSTPEEQSPSDDGGPKPTPQEKAAADAEAARAAVHTEAAAYKINLPDEQRQALGLADDADPILKGVTEHFAAAGKSQGALDDFMATAGELAKAGLFGTGFDPAAEAAALGENAAERRTEIESFANAVKARGEIDDGEYGELMSLAATAAGVKLVEKLRGWMGEKGQIPTPDTATGGGDDVEAAKAMARDPRYGVDRDFTKQADAAWQKAHRKR